MELIAALTLAFVIAGLWAGLRATGAGPSAKLDGVAELGGDDDDDLPPGASKFYAGQRHRPPGQWVKAISNLSVAGAQHRRRDVEVWAVACERAEDMKCSYGVALELDPHNRHDSNAIKVIGWATFDSEHNWHIGYVPRDQAARLNREFVDAGISLAAELISIYQGADDFLDIRISVLRPRTTNAEKAA